MGLLPKRTRAAQSTNCILKIVKIEIKEALVCWNYPLDMSKVLNGIYKLE